MNVPDGIVIFEISGAMAHFRKAYTNSSSLTYMLPPRTTLSGMVAAILGRPRDSYYEELGPSRSLLTVSLRTRVRTVMQTMNNLLIKSPSELSGSSGHTQVPTELIVSEDLGRQIVYRVYFSHEDKGIMEEVNERIAHGEPVYPVTLGTSSMLASLSLVAELPSSRLERIEPQCESSVVTPCLLEHVDSLASPAPSSPFVQPEMVKDLMPYSFGLGRTNAWSREFLFERKGQPLSLRLNCPALRVTYEDGESEVIVFPEEGKSQ